ncbi:MAG: hypothetical protein L3K19_02405 [Thermoplasmata archaeon]|nr:hypothetical protein [Thermoplasmata archaeon]
MTGRFVLVHEDELVGVFATEHEAVRRGFDLLGAVPFLVREVPAAPPGGRPARTGTREAPP